MINAIIAISPIAGNIILPPNNAITISGIVASINNAKSPPPNRNIITNNIIAAIAAIVIISISSLPFIICNVSYAKIKEGVICVPFSLLRHSRPHLINLAFLCSLLSSFTIGRNTIANKKKTRGYVFKPSCLFDTNQSSIRLNSFIAS